MIRLVSTSDPMVVRPEFFGDVLSLRSMMHMHSLPADLKGSQHVKFVSKGRTEEFDKKYIYQLHQIRHKIKDKRICRDI